MRKQTQRARKHGFCECGSQVGCSLERSTAQVEKLLWAAEGEKPEIFLELIRRVCHIVNTKGEATAHKVVKPTFTGQVTR